MRRLSLALSLVLVCAAVLGAAACGTKQAKNADAPAPQPSAEAISKAKRDYTEALAKAKDWQPNATLTRVFRVYKGSLSPSEPVPLSFSFGSLAQPTEAFVVEASEQGLTDRKEKKQPFEINLNPINVGNWEIDPDRALQIAEENGGQQFRESHLAGYVVLVQLSQSGNHPLQWYVRYDTGDASAMRFEVYLNATTGKVEAKEERKTQ